MSKISPEQLAQLQPGKILLLLQERLGDLVLLTPLFEALAKRYPGVKLDLFTDAAGEPILRGNPYLNQVHYLCKDRLKSFGDQLRFYRQTGCGNYDLLVNFQHKMRCKLVAFLSNAKIRLASSEGSPWPDFYDLRLPWLNVYHGWAYIRMLEPLGLDWLWTKPQIYLSQAEVNLAKTWLHRNGLTAQQRLLTIDPAQRWESKGWPPERFAALLDILAESDPRLRFYLIGAPSEQETLRQVADLTRNHNRLLGLGQPLPLREVLGIISQSQFHLGVCSGPRHFASAFDVPTLIVSDPGWVPWTYPSIAHQVLVSEQYGRGGHPDYPEQAGLLDVTVDSFAQKARQMLAQVETTSTMRQTPQTSAVVG